MAEPTCARLKQVRSLGESLEIAPRHQRTQDFKYDQ
jgi:hypothetical protein